MLTLTGITKCFGGRTLFEDVSLQVNRQDRIGLVGPNGAGKTTLFTLILQNEQADAGQVIVQRNTTMGYLPQESSPVADETVLELASAVRPEFVSLQRQIKEAEIPAMEVAKARFDELGGYGTLAKAKQILSGLGFRQSDFDRPCREMSGGWVMRTHLARLLVQEPDLLMLDEPTNHLDLEALIWFQNYLKNYPGAILVISHDREFLNQLVDDIVEIRYARLRRYRGDYDEFLVQRDAEEEQLLAAYKNQQREIAHLMQFVERFRAKNTKATQAQSKLKQIERMEKIDAPLGQTRSIAFSFPQAQRGGLKVITLEGVDHAYGSQVVYQGMEFQAERGERIVLVGPNGAGKSTLLKLLAGVLPVQRGSRQLGHNVRSGYYAQYRVDMLDRERTVLEEAFDTPQPVTEQFVRTVLGSFHFRGDDVFKKVNVLSGGEKSRLALVKLLLDPPNLLLMDEPTTHLDMPSIDALVAALQPYRGTLIFISHDVYFIRALANRVVRVEAGMLIHYPGDYQYYLDKSSADAGRMAQPSPAAGPDERPSARLREQKRIEAEERQARYRLRKAQEKIVHDLEAEIAALECRQTELTAELEDPETYQAPGRAAAVNRELASVVASLQARSAVWEHEASKLEQILAPSEI